MGWMHCYSWDTKADAVRALTTTEFAPGRVIAHTIRGNTLWLVYERDPATPGPAERAIICVLLRSGRGEGWGYKDMDESMGPTDTSCPLAYLDMVPEPSYGYAREWRERVRAAHRERAARRKIAATIKPGVTLVLKQGCTPAKVRITEVKPLRGYDDRGVLYRVSPRHVDHVEV